MHESLTELEIELCRLPGVIVTRFVGGSEGRPLGATVFVAAGAIADQIRAGIRTIASVHFDIDIDPSRMVIFEVGETSILAPEASAVSVETDSVETDSVETDSVETDSVEPPTGTSTVERPSDSRQALIAAQEAVHSLLRSLTPPSPVPDHPQTSSPPKPWVEAETVIVNNSDTAEAGPLDH